MAETMNTCPFCQFENTPGVMICARCGQMMVRFEPGQQTTVPTPPEETRVLDDQLLSTIRQHKHTGRLQRTQSAFYFGSADEPLIVEIREQLILGRETLNSKTQDLLDLSPYGGFEKGVSRMHAIIRRGADNVLTLEDLASRNGTWINGVRLQPYIFRPLKSGMKLKLSHLEIEIFLNEEPQ